MGPTSRSRQLRLGVWRIYNDGLSHVSVTEPSYFGDPVLAKFTHPPLSTTKYEYKRCFGNGASLSEGLWHGHETTQTPTKFQRGPGRLYSPFTDAPMEKGSVLDMGPFFADPNSIQPLNIRY